MFVVVEYVKHMASATDAAVRFIVKDSIEQSSG